VVRLEAERKDAGLVVHNYGHSGAGITLSWACAEEVASFVQVSEYWGL
jgi:D-amino-acid oxidase